MKFAPFEPIELADKTATIEVIELPCSSIIPDQNQPRKNFNEDALHELTSSINQHGLIQPIIVRKIGEKQFQIVAGERRWRAAKMAGLEALPVIVQSNEVKQNFAVSLIENIQREDLNSIEIAEAFYRLNNEHELSHEAIARMVGKNRATVTNVLRLLNLPKFVQKLLIDKKLEMGHAKVLLALPPDRQIALAQIIVEKQLTVRDTEKLVRGHKQATETIYNPFIDEINLCVEDLSKILSTKVDVKIDEKGQGRLIIHFKSKAKINWLLETLTVRE